MHFVFYVWEMLLNFICYLFIYATHVFIYSILFWKSKPHGIVVRCITMEMYFSLPLLLNSSVKFLIISSLNFSLLFFFFIIFVHRCWSSKCVQAAYCGLPHYTKQHLINYASHREIMRCFALYHSFIVSFEFYVPVFYGHFCITSFFSLS